MVAVSEEEMGRLLGESGNDSQSSGHNRSNQRNMNSSMSSEGSMSLGLGGGNGNDNGGNGGGAAADLSVSFGGSQGSLLLDESESSQLSYKETDVDAASLSTTLLDESTNNEEDEEDPDIPILGAGAKGVGSSSSHDDNGLQKAVDGENEDAQEMMKDHLELMLEIVMRIREDEEFASSIYDNCPRLQYLLDQNPDLRPVFEDPHLVQINFEKVYRDAGGVLPEDKPSRFQVILARIVNHPLFKVLKFLLLVKKLVNCIMGGGFSFVRGSIKGCIGGLCCDGAADVAITDAAEQDSQGGASNAGQGGGGGSDGGGEGGEGSGEDQYESSPENQANREALNRAADHMEDPEVQERMQDILELDDEDALADAIENDPELKALRDSNPLCAELMSDPDTMKILIDPDNLRALGEAPDLIEQDFANPDWTPPDIESGPESVSADGIDVDVDADAGGASSDALNGRLETVAEADFEGEHEDVDDSFGASQDLEGQLADFDADADADAEGNADGEAGDGEVPEEAGEASLMELEAVEEEGEETAAEEEEEKGMEYELGDEEVENDNKQAAAAKGQQQKSQSKSSNNNNAEGGGRAGFISSAAVGLRDMLAAELIGVTYSEITGQDELIPLDQAEQAAEDTATAAEGAAANAETMGKAVAASEVLMSDEVAGNLEDVVEAAEDTHAEKAESAQAAGAAASTAGGAVVVGGATGGAGSRSRDIESGHSDGDDTAEEVPPAAQAEGEEDKKKSRFGFVGNWAGAVATAGKEYIATSILGDDLGEMLVAKLEEDEDSDEDDDDANKKEEEKSKPKGLFRRKEG